MSDLIDRARAQAELQLLSKRYTFAHEAHGCGTVEWSDYLIKTSDALDLMRTLPSEQPERTDDYARGFNDAKREIQLSGEYERAYQRGKDDAQKRKTGRWIEEWIDDKHIIGSMCCSECRSHMRLWYTPFCPYCGSYNRGEQ